MEKFLKTLSIIHYHPHSLTTETERFLRRASRHRLILCSRRKDWPLWRWRWWHRLIHELINNLAQQHGGIRIHRRWRAYSGGNTLPRDDWSLALLTRPCLVYIDERATRSSYACCSLQALLLQSTSVIRPAVVIDNIFRFSQAGSEGFRTAVCLHGYQPTFGYRWASFGAYYFHQGRLYCTGSLRPCRLSYRPLLLLQLCCT